MRQGMWPPSQSLATPRNFSYRASALGEEPTSPFYPPNLLSGPRGQTPRTPHSGRPALSQEPRDPTERPILGLLFLSPVKRASAFSKGLDTAAACKLSRPTSARYSAGWHSSGQSARILQGKALACRLREGAFESSTNGRH
jgi:hypothetical protein